MKAARLLAPLAALILGVFAFAPPSHAACNPLSLCSCTTSSAGVSFGAYNPLSSSPTDVVGAVTVSCTMVVSRTGSYTIGLSTGSSGSYAARTMKRSTTNLTYNLYTSAGRAIVWGNASAGTQMVTGSLSAVFFDTQTFNIYGRIPAGQNVAPGSYSDTVTVTVTY